VAIAQVEIRLDAIEIKGIKKDLLKITDLLVSTEGLERKLKMIVFIDISAV
jgi:hypothetical protein